MKNEKEFQDAVIGMFVAKGGHAVNMEPNVTNPGIPDINWCLHGIEGNLELKFAYDGGAAPMIRPNQIVWFRERIRAGGYPMFGYYVECESYMDEVYIFQGRHYEELAKAKDLEDIYELPNLRVINPLEFVEAVVSEMASWHDEVDPPASDLILPPTIG